MSTLVVYSDAIDGFIEYDSTVYATARGGTGGATVDTTATSGDAIGQTFSSPTYYLVESFLSFDTSALGAGATVTAAVLDLYGSADNSVTDFTILCASLAWGTLTSADWQDGTELAALTPLSQFVIGGGGFSIAGYNTLSDLGGMAASVNKTGNTQYVLWSDRQESNTTPTGDEFVRIWFGDEGSTKRPRLTITYTGGGVAAPIIGGGFLP